MWILGIESSCDETGAAVVQVPQSGVGAPVLKGHALHSQAVDHQVYGGVVPELASRDHIRRVLPLTQQALKQAGIGLQDLDFIAYTQGPGLAGALLVGAATAEAMAAGLDIPTLPIHHLEGHLLSPFLSDPTPEFPFVALLVSGGHTQLMRVDGVGRYTLLGETIDDAAGEAFDKAAKVLGLPYPGGPELAKLAVSGNDQRFALPRPLLHSKDLDFSFAGLKTAVWTQRQKLADTATPQDLADLAACTQAAITDVLLKKTMNALQQQSLKRLVVAGGVGANQRLRERLNLACAKAGIQVNYPPLAWCTDNGAMIAMAAGMRVQAGLAQAHLSKTYSFEVRPRWPLEMYT
ncbi:MAG: hypothetical protein RLZZ397_100 [Pseudomonadota bacterium]|jgi:N6-L-threonylcarbamoyladenine synthase